MSRSFRKAIFKDRIRNGKSSSIYWRKVRRVMKQDLKNSIEKGEDPLKTPKTIVNDYDFSDYTIADSYTEIIPK